MIRVSLLLGATRVPSFNWEAPVFNFERMLPLRSYLLPNDSSFM